MNYQITIIDTSGYSSTNLSPAHGNKKGYTEVASYVDIVSSTIFPSIAPNKAYHVAIYEYYHPVVRAVFQPYTSKKITIKSTRPRIVNPISTSNYTDSFTPVINTPGYHVRLVEIRTNSSCRG